MYTFSEVKNRMHDASGLNGADPNSVQWYFSGGRYYPLTEQAERAFFPLNAILRNYPTIRTINEAKCYLTDLRLSGYDYHPDDSTHEIAWGHGPHPTNEQCDHMNALMATIRTKRSFDTCAYLLTISGHYTGYSITAYKFKVIMEHYSVITSAVTKEQAIKQSGFPESQANAFIIKPLGIIKPLN